MPDNTSLLVASLASLPDLENGLSSSPRNKPARPAGGKRPRVLIYSQDGMGLGHLRRTHNIARQITARDWNFLFP